MLKLAIVGRPNVGKSALFNRICKKKVAIVDGKEGTTRDRLYGKGELSGLPFLVIDTGGIDTHSHDSLTKKIVNHSFKGIEEADSLLMVVDGKVGITPHDEEIARMLLKTKKPLLLAVNKIDNEAEEELIHQFYSLGIKNILPISALLGLRIEEMVAKAWDSFTLLPEMGENKKIPKLIVLGRPNVGKSTLINALLGEERVIASPIAGTTVDAVTIPCTLGGQDFLLIDTAGIRRKNKEREQVEKFATMRRERALEEADIALVICQASSGITQEEKKILKEVRDSGKACIVLFNKWDLVKGFRMEHCHKALIQENPLLAHLPLLFISAQDKRNLNQVIATLAEVKESYEQQVATSSLNKCIRSAFEALTPPVIDNRRLVIYYATQIKMAPPRFLLFVNHPSLLSVSYKRYLIAKMHATFSFSGVPVDFVVRGKTSAKRESVT